MTAAAEKHIDDGTFMIYNSVRIALSSLSYCKKESPKTNENTVNIIKTLRAKKIQV